VTVRPVAPTPYDLVFGDARFESDVFPALEAEADARGIDAASPDSFMLLGQVGVLLRELPAPEPASAHAAVTAFGALLFHAFHFRRHGRRIWSAGDAALEQIVGGDPLPTGWVVAAPHPAGYVILPHQRLWSRVDEAAPAEPVHGFFWTMAASDASGAQRRLHVLLALGVRPARPGLSVIPAAVALEQPADWLHAAARAEGADFANVLPGGELRSLHAVVSPAEALKLAARAFWLMSAAPGEPGLVRALEQGRG
jgi:hypothetical protein